MNEKLRSYLTINNTVKCKCGHSVTIINKYKRLICNWCGYYVYLYKEDEFKDKMKGLLKIK